jgi:hypothetical protein
MDRDNITRTGARAPGVERLDPLARRCLTGASSLTQSREYMLGDRHPYRDLIVGL